MGALRTALVSIIMLGGVACNWQDAAPARADAGVPAVSVGEAFIDFTAKDSTGADFTLSALKGKPILLKFFRGHW